jgi:hypothetical protein
VERTAILLEKVGLGRMVEADLINGVSDDHLNAWRKTWLPELASARQRLVDAQIPREKWPRDLHWSWDAKMAEARAAFLSYQAYSIVCDGDLQGLMLVNLTKRARILAQQGKDLVYVEYLASAPWNREDLLCTPRFRGVGGTFIGAATELSRQSEFQGRIGLHSLVQSHGFYEERCGMTPLGKDPKYGDLVYFEMTPEQANSFRSIRKDPQK